MKTKTHKNVIKLSLSILALSISLGVNAQNSKAPTPAKPSVPVTPKTTGKMKVIQIIDGDTTSFERDFQNFGKMSFANIKDFDINFSDSLFKDLDSLKDLHFKFAEEFKDLDSLKDFQMMVSNLPKHKMILKKLQGNMPNVDSLLKSINFKVDFDKNVQNQCKIIIKSGKNGNLNTADKFFDKDAEIIVNGDTMIISKKVIIKIVEPSKKEEKQIGLSVKSEKLNVQNINIYPNPGNGEYSLVFSLPEKGDTKISVSDITGKEVFKENLKDFSGNYFNQINLGKEPNGIYFLNVEQNGKQVIKKLIKQ